MPKLTDLLLAEMDIEMPGTRRALERVPEGRDDWKPHEKSMPLGYLAKLVATMPGWIVSMVTQPAIDLAAPDGHEQPDSSTSAVLLRTFDQAMADARRVIGATTDDHLLTTRWRLMMGETVLSEQSRYEAVRVSALNHLYHHRAQLTTYLRLNEQKVPSLYGPTADEPLSGA